MTAGKRVEFAPWASSGVTHDSVWTVALAPSQRTSPAERGTDMSPDLAELECATVQVRMALEEMTVAARAAVAGARAIVEVMDAAVAVLEVAERASAFESTSAAATPYADVLSPREREVLTLVAEGRSNKAIAAELFISPNTIKTHVASLMNKLHVDTRAQLAAIVARQGVHPNEIPVLGDMQTLAS